MRITLSPLNPEFQPIVLTQTSENDVQIVAELIAAVLNRKTPARVRGERLRAYWRAARLSFSAGEGGPRVGAA